MTKLPESPPEIPFRRPEVSDTLVRRRLKESLGQAPQAGLEASQAMSPKNVES